MRSTFLLLLCGDAASLQVVPWTVRPPACPRANAAPLMQFSEEAREVMRQEMQAAAAAQQEVAQAQIAAQWVTLESALPVTESRDAPFLTLCRSSGKKTVLARNSPCAHPCVLQKPICSELQSSGPRGENPRCVSAGERPRRRSGACSKSL